jgi:hypothetical protein
LEKKLDRNEAFELFSIKYDKDSAAKIEDEMRKVKKKIQFVENVLVSFIRI